MYYVRLTHANAMEPGGVCLSREKEGQGQLLLYNVGPVRANGSVNAKIAVRLWRRCDLRIRPTLMVGRGGKFRV